MIICFVLEIRWVDTVLTNISLGSRFDTVALGAAYKEPQSENDDADFFIKTKIMMHDDYRWFLWL